MRNYCKLSFNYAGFWSVDYTIPANIRISVIQSSFQCKQLKIVQENEYAYYFNTCLFTILFKMCCSQLIL